MPRLVDEVNVPGTEPGRRRSGGREARRAMRAAPPSGAQSPVKPGMSSDNYRPLSQNDMERIHEAALTVLEEVGMGQPIDSCIEVCVAAGADYGEDGRLRFPRGLVMDTVKHAGAQPDPLRAGPRPRYAALAQQGAFRNRRCRCSHC